MINYYAYIKSKAWFARTESVRLRNRGICECCNMRYGTCVHHRTYVRLGKETDADLLHVCKYCHKMIHKKGVFKIWNSRLILLEMYQREISNELDKERDL